MRQDCTERIGERRMREFGLAMGRMATERGRRRAGGAGVRRGWPGRARRGDGDAEGSR
jgi:hypothetical protein